MVLSLDIFVAGIPLDIKDSEFKALFQSYGSVTFSTIVKDKETNKSRGFGFVKMSNEIEAWLAIEATNRTKIKGKNLFAKKADPRKENSPTLLDNVQERL